MSKTNYTHILKYAGLFGSVQILGIAVNILRNKLAAVLLGPDGFGLSAIFSSATRLFSDATNLGLPVSGVKMIADSYGKEEDLLAARVCLIRSYVLLTALLGTVLFLASIPLIDHFTFSWGNHQLHFLLLSPIVGMTILSSGEIAILKGMRQLNTLAKVSIYHLLAALFVSIPIYYFWGLQGIVPSLVILSAIHLLLVYSFSVKILPLRFSLANPSFLRAGIPMLKLGMAFVATGVLGSGAEFLVRSFLNRMASVEVVGLYTAGFSMMMTYAAIAFSSMDSDYFPRLATVVNDVPSMNKTVNEQAEVSLLIIAPLFIVFIVCLPFLLPLLYSGRFIPVIDMLRVAAIAMYIRSIKLPVEYIPLSKGDYFSHVFLEAVYFVLFVICALWGYAIGGLTGMGYGILFNSMFSYVVVLVYTRKKYSYRMSGSLQRYVLLQLPIGVGMFLLTFFTTGLAYWAIGAISLLLSSGISLYILKKKTTVLEGVRRRLKGIWGRNKNG